MATKKTPSQLTIMLAEINKLRRRTARLRGKATISLTKAELEPLFAATKAFDASHRRVGDAIALLGAVIAPSDRSGSPVVVKTIKPQDKSGNPIVVK